MRKHLLIVTSLIFHTISYGQLPGKNFIDQNYIEVTGTAEEEIIPDEIYLQVIINEKDNRGKASLRQLEMRMIKKLQELGIDVEEQLSIKDLASSFQFYFLQKTEVFATREYEILLYDAKTAGNVMLALKELEISNLSIHRVDHSAIDSLNLAVKLQAIKNAHAKADAMAKAIGQQIGKAMYIQETGEEGNSNVLRGQVAGVRIRGASSIYGSRAAPPNIDFQKLQLQSKVHVKFLLQ